MAGAGPGPGRGPEVWRLQEVVPAGSSYAW